MPGQPARDSDYRDLIHLLNQRYYLAWQRAEQLQRELNRFRRWFGAPLLALRWLKRCLLPSDLESTSLPRLAPLEELPGPVSGRVSIIIPFKDRLELLRGCLRSLRLSRHRDTEIILIDNGSREKRTLRYLDRLQGRGMQVVSCPGAFNFSWLCNQGAQRASGDFVVFLNNDTEVLTPDWLGRLLRLAGRSDVGVVGGTLLYPDGTIQHAGLHPLPDGRWVHTHRGRHFGEQGQWRLVRQAPAVTGACLLMRRQLFLDVGGFDERLPVTYGDVELCCRVRQRGLLVAVTPRARLLHFEGLSRGFQGDTPGAEHLAGLERFPQGNRAVQGGE